MNQNALLEIMFKRLFPRLPGEEHVAMTNDQGSVSPPRKSGFHKVVKGPLVTSASFLAEPDLHRSLFSIQCLTSSVRIREVFQRLTEPGKLLSGHCVCPSLVPQVCVFSPFVAPFIMSLSVRIGQPPPNRLSHFMFSSC